VDDGELYIRGRRVRVGVSIRGLAMGGPASVGNAQMARELLIEVQALLESLLAQDCDLHGATQWHQQPTQTRPSFP
jgi:hypothetical protein